ncbi:hypothetical protein [Janthinobacterium psychrotolerans]|uniref:Uncharacterized protein n=1 Tax=Janthinobacterium psychrotolerans TaxID=1747903 RepID=A0A1A7C5T3_9BURK|nr:hypothetical protein [Janthinobacterium psychrotolerans]OBV39658.1 hypothetical protein ASR47_101147 [Janthinobacterium psychrotolerans]
MTTTLSSLPYRATADQACQWLQTQTGTPWTLARLLEEGGLPYVWIDYSQQWAELFHDGVTRYAAPVVFIEDKQHLAAGGTDVLLRFTRDSGNLAIALQEPGLRASLDGLHFQERDLLKLVKELLNPTPVEPETPLAPQESLKGLERHEIVQAFAGVGKINLEQGMLAGQGIFGDDGARVRKNSRGGKNNYLWNPVTLAFGLHDVHRVPMPHLKKAFATQPQLRPWKAAWLESLALLGE